WTNVANIPSFVPKAASVPAGSRNRPTSISAGSRNRPTSIPAGRPFTAGWKNHAARPMTRPSSHYFQYFSRPGYYNQMYMDEGRWGTAVKPSADSGCSRSMTGNKEKLDDFVKIVGDENVADLLTKAFDGPRFNHLVVHIGMLNP
ncbi:hypothetical protein Tco_0081631, partial [Tanacetum coccineum]